MDPLYTATLFLLPLVCIEVSGQGVPPTSFESYPQAVQIKEVGESTRLTCVAATGTNPRLFTWLKDGALVPERVNSTNGNLQLRLDKTTAGNYRCIASNKYGSILGPNATVFVAVFEANWKNQPTKRLSYNAGSSAIISLPTYNVFPTPKVQWTADGRSITDFELRLRHFVSEISFRLVLLDIQKGSDTNYQATMSLLYSADRHTTGYYTVAVFGNKKTDTMPPQPVIRPQKVTFPSLPADKITKNVFFECVFNARPLKDLRILWFHRRGASRTLLQESRHFAFLSLNRTLKIIEVTAADSGFFDCEAHLPGVTPVVLSAELKVLSKAKIVRGASTDITVNYGERKELECSGSGDPAPTIRWYRNAVLMAALNGDKTVSLAPKSPEFQLLPTGSLVLKSASPSHAGMFQCYVENSVGQDLRTIWLRIASAAPTIVLPPQNTTHIQDETATLVCKASGAPKPEIAWYKGSSSSRIVSSAGIKIHDGSLLIVRSKPSDSGTYTCVTTNVMGSALARAQLRIIVRTRITSPPAPSLSVVKHDSLRIPCGYEHDPAVSVRVQWFLTKAVVGAVAEEVTRSPGMQTSSDGSLNVDHVVFAGVYKCVISSFAGNDSAQTNVTVKSLPDKPTITKAGLNPSQQRAVDLAWTAGFDGNSPILEFIIFKTEMKLGAPTANYAVVTSVAPHLRKYTVTGLLSSRTYKFCVGAKNEVGQSAHCGESVAIKMPQLPPSGPPRSVFASSPSNDTITVQWSAPAEEHQNGEITGFILRYRAYKYASFHDKNISNPSTRRFTLANLVPFTEYDVRVAAYNAMGLGNFSTAYIVRTQEGTPTAPPTEVRLRAINSTAVDISWKPLIRSDVNGINQGYKIFLRCVDPAKDCPDRLVTVPHDDSREGGPLNAVVRSLRKYALYRITLWCYTSVGNGKASSPKEVRTKEDKPGAVSNLRFEEVVDTSISVKWGPPRFENGRIIGYTLSYYVRDVVSPKIDSFNLSPSTRSKRITDLRHQTWYMVTVVAKTAAGDGEPSTSSVRSGVPPKKPGAPSNLVWSNALARTVIVQFRPGFDGNTSISKWIFEAQTPTSETSNPWFEVFAIKAPDVDRLTVLNLRPHTRYRLRLIAENIKGRSQPSIPTEWFWTQEAPPDTAPGGLLMRVVNASSIQARWRPLLKNSWNGIPKGYRIFYRLTSRPDSSSFATKDVLGPNANSLLISNLQAFTEYEMKIGAFNDRGVGPTSALVKDMTWEAPPNTGPRDVTLRVLNASAIEVSWTVLPNASANGVLLGYRVFHRLTGATEHTKVITDPLATNFTIGGLIGYSTYSVQVAAYNRLGVGPRAPKLAEKATTHRAPPSAPVSVFFPSVNESDAVLVWKTPIFPQGEINSFRLSYGLQVTAMTTSTLPASARSFTASSLEAKKTYTFELRAVNGRGPGTPAVLKVVTTKDRKVPMQTSKPSVLTSKSGATYVAITWSPKWQSDAPIRNYTVQYKRNDAASGVPPPWQTVLNAVMTNQVTISGLSPFTSYLFRVASNNDVGRSPFSASVVHQTDATAPSTSPHLLSIEPVDRTTLELRWKGITSATWNGQPSGYRIFYKRWRLGDAYRVTDVGHWQISARLSALTPGWYYELRLAAFNTQGEGPQSIPKIAYVGEARPTASPPSFECNTHGATIIKCSWKSLPSDKTNGDLLGFKIFIRSLGLIGSRRRRRAAGSERMVAVTSASSAASISDLRPFHRYNVRILAFNPAGDGPPSSSFEVRTAESVPGMPGPVKVSEVTLQSARLTWDPPSEPNGRIMYYRVQFHQKNAADGLVRKVEDIIQAQSGKQPEFLAQGLEKHLEYIFLVSARTRVGWGPSRNASATTGPQLGSPSAPIQLSVVQDSASAELRWRVTDRGDSPLVGAIIDAQRQNSDVWTIVQYLRPGQPVLFYRVDFQKLQPNSYYRFRVTVVNRSGISGASAPSAWVKTPDYGQGPFYKQWWFLVIVALCGVILIILTASILCLTGRNRRARSRARARTHQKYGYDNNGLAFDVSRGYMEPEDGGFSAAAAAAARDRDIRYGTVGRHSQGLRSPPGTLPRTSHSTSALGPEIHSTLSRKHMKSPPRPSPASVLTAGLGSSDDDSKHPIPSSKASSSSGASSQKRRPESDSEFTDEFDEEDNFTKVPPPLSFVGVRQAPGSGIPSSAPPPWEMSGFRSSHNPYSLSDTESTLPYQQEPNRLSLNKAGSRAPIPSYSSFV